MIFAHSIIPHNHIDDDCCLHAGYVHSALNHHNHNSSVAEFSSYTSDFASCSISNILFQKFSPDENIIIVEEISASAPVVVFSRIIPGDNQQSISGADTNTTLLRAPPMA